MSIVHQTPGRPHFELRRLTEYDDEAILAELRRVATLVPDGAFLESDFERLGRVGRNTIRRRFGSWFRALDAAGPGHRSTDQIKARGGHASSRMSNDQILAKLRELADKPGRSALTKSDVIQYLPFSDQISRAHWGTIRAAFEAAGLQATNLGRRYTDEECFDNMLRVWTRFGRPPMHKEMSAPPSTVGGKAYMRRFGTWTKALAAFVERVNQDAETRDQHDPDSTLAAVSAAAPATVRMPLARSQEDSRDVPLGLRFRVLHRDRFKCVLCGDHPARNTDCVLHVDHLIPWSKGGRTTEDNLRALCARCNAGRGNRFSD